MTPWASVIILAIVHASPRQHYSVIGAGRFRHGDISSAYSSRPRPRDASLQAFRFGNRIQETVPVALPSASRYDLRGGETGLAYRQKLLAVPGSVSICLTEMGIDRYSEGFLYGFRQCYHQASIRLSMTIRRSCYSHQLPTISFSQSAMKTQRVAGYQRRNS